MMIYLCLSAPARHRTSACAITEFSFELQMNPTGRLTDLDVSARHDLDALRLFDHPLHKPTSAERLLCASKLMNHVVKNPLP